MAGLAVRLLGGPRYEIEGSPLYVGGPPTLHGFLAYLLLHRGAWNARSTIAFALWPDAPESAARANLRRHLYLLVRALPQTARPWVITQEESLRWNDAAETSVDVEAFEACAGDPSRVEEALRLYAGDLLPEMYDEWVVPLREHLRATYAAALRAAIHSARERRDYSRVIALGERMLAADPYSEDALRHVVVARYESGDRAGALRTCDDFTQRLEREMQLECMPETRALRDSVLHNEPLPLVPAAPAIARATEHETLPFVGRDAELDDLHAIWLRAARGRGGIALLGGEAGIGKTRLATELALRVENEGARVLRGATSAPEQIPYQALVEVLRAAKVLLDPEALKPVLLEALRPLLPELGPPPTTQPTIARLDAEGERIRLQDAFAAAFLALARPRPLLVLLEDLHWAGSANLEAVAAIGRRVASAPVLVLSTYRTDDADAQPHFVRWRRRLLRDAQAAHVALGGLSRDAIRLLVERIGSFQDPVDRVVRDTYDLSAGNPLFAGELLRDALERGLPLATSRSLRAVIAARCARLEPQTRIIAEVASVVGASFDVDVVQRAAGCEEAHVSKALAVLVAGHVARPADDVRYTFAFAHQTIQETLYDSIDATRRIRLHRDVAAVLESLEENDPVRSAGVLALHLDAAGEGAAAARWYVRAAHQAYGACANEQAERFVRRALSLPGVNDSVRFELFAIAERLADRRGERNEQEQAIDALDELAARCGELKWKARALGMRIALANALGDRRIEEATIAQLRILARTLRDPLVDADVLEARARQKRDRGRHAAAVLFAQSAAQARAEGGDPRGRVRALAIAATSAAARADPQAQAIAAQAQAAAAGDPALELRALEAAATVSHLRQDYTAYAELSRRVVEACAVVGDRRGEANARAQFGTAAAHLWQIADAREQLEHGAALADEFALPHTLLRCLINLGDVELHLGLLEAALEHFERAERVARDAGVPAPIARGNRVQALALLGRANEALRLAAGLAGEIRRDEDRRLQPWGYFLLGLAKRAAGDARDAAHDLRAALEGYRELGRPLDVWETQIELALTLCQSGDLDAAWQSVGEAMAADRGETGAWIELRPRMFALAAHLAELRADGSAAALQACARRAMDACLRRIPDEASRQAFAALPFHRRPPVSTTPVRSPSIT